MDEEERLYWKSMTHKCERKYEYLIDKLALLLSEEKIKEIKEGEPLDGSRRNQTRASESS